MARPGITYAEVARAATQLAAQKTRPSIEAVRKILGTGSNSTINRHLREWHNTQGVKTELEQGLPDSLLIAVRGIYDALREQADSQLEQATQAHKEIVTQLRAQIDTLETSEAQLKQAKVNLQNTLAELQQTQLALQRQLANKTKENEQQASENHLLTERLADKQAELERLSQLLQHTQTNLEHYRDTQRQERLNDKQAYEDKLAALAAQHQVQQGLVSEARETIAQLKQHIEWLETTQETEAALKQDALAKAQRYESDWQASELRLAQLQEKQAQLLSAQQSFTKRADGDQAKLQAFLLQTEKQKERIELYEVALKKGEDDLKSLADKHLFLMQEKTELACQLKQVLEAS